MNNYRKQILFDLECAVRCSPARELHGWDAIIDALAYEAGAITPVSKDFLAALVLELGLENLVKDSRYITYFKSAGGEHSLVDDRALKKLRYPPYKNLQLGESCIWFCGEYYGHW